MRVLLDTHVYLWCLSGSSRLSMRARQEIQHAEDVFVSAASIWEAAIKSASGKLQVKVNDLVENIELSGFRQLAISARHAAAAAMLPSHHRDPFDRMLIAQAMQEPMRLLTADVQLRRYSDLVKLI